MADNLDRLDSPRVRARMISVLTAVVAVSVLLFSFVTLVLLDRAVAPEIQQRTQLIGSVVRDDLQQALSVGIPIQAVGGLDSYLGSMIDEFAEIRQISVVSSKGEMVANVERAEVGTLLDRLEIGKRLGMSGSELQMPILVGNELVGEIHLVTSGQFVESRLRSVLLDASVLALAVILIGVELTLVMASNSIWRPLAAIVALARGQAKGSFVHTVAPNGLPTLRLMARRLNDQALHLAERLSSTVAATTPTRMALPDLADMRLALFTFAAATEVTASFLPIYARGAARPDWLEPGFAAAAPSALYLAALAVLSPFAGKVVARFGPGKVFGAVSIPTALALIGMAATDSVAGVILCRGAIAVCYAFATIACQDYALALRQGRDGAKVPAVIMAMVFGGTFCGATIGGIFADRYGYEAAMLLGGLLTIVAGLIGYRGLRASTTRALQSTASVALASKPAIFYAFLFGIVVPMNLVTAVCIWYMAPLRLTALDASPAEIARVIMLFYLSQLLLGPLATRLAESRLGLIATMFLGAVIAAASLATFGTETFWLMTGTVAGVGVGFGLLRGPALEFASRHAEGAPGRLTTYRVAERAVAFVALLVAASVIGTADGDRILMGLCLVVSGGLMIFTVAAATDHRNGRF